MFNPLSMSIFNFFFKYFFQILGVFVKSPVQKFQKPQKSPGDILTLNDYLYHTTYPGHLQMYFKGVLDYLVAGLFFVEIISDFCRKLCQTILVYFENFQNRSNMTFYGLK